MKLKPKVPPITKAKCEDPYFLRHDLPMNERAYFQKHHFSQAINPILYLIFQFFEMSYEFNYILPIIVGLIILIIGVLGGLGGVGKLS